MSAPQRFALFFFVCVFGLAVFFIASPKLDKFRAELPPCLEFGQPFHHRLRISCRGTVPTPTGSVGLSTNEDGLRDRSRRELLAQPHRVMLLGDSFVEGWWLDFFETFGSRLGQLFPGWYFLNAGLRSTGPLFQAAALPERLATYRPEKILLFLNETDLLDDRLACALFKNNLEEFGLDDLQDPWALRAVASILSEESTFYRTWRQFFYRRRWRQLVESDGAQRCDPCLGISSIKSTADSAHVSLMAIYVPINESFRESGPYFSVVGAKETLLACLKKKEIPFFEAAIPSGRADLYWPGDIHLNAVGVSFVTGAVAPALQPWLNASTSPSGQSSRSNRSSRR